MDLELIHKPSQDNVVLNALHYKERYNEKPSNKIQSLQVIFVLAIVALRA